MKFRIFVIQSPYRRYIWWTLLVTTKRGIIFLIGKLLSHIFAISSQGGHCKEQKDEVIHEEVKCRTLNHLFIIKTKRNILLQTQKKTFFLWVEEKWKILLFLTLNSLCMSFPRLCPSYSLPLNNIDLNRISKDSK